MCALASGNSLLDVSDDLEPGGGESSSSAGADAWEERARERETQETIRGNE